MGGVRIWFVFFVPEALENRTRNTQREIQVKNRCKFTGWVLVFITAVLLLSSPLTTRNGTGTGTYHTWYSWSRFVGTFGYF